MSKKTMVILVLGVLLILGMIVSVQEEKSKYRKVMETAIYIDDNTTLDESLEGKFVILSGTPKMSKGAYDPDFDIQFDYPVVYRSAWVLYDTGTGAKHETEWQTTYRSEKNIYGQTNLCGEAKIGAYTIGGDVMKYVFETRTKDIVTEEMAVRTGWVYCDHQKWSARYLLSKPLTYENDIQNWLDRGMMRVGFSAKEDIGLPCTVFGYLQNGQIISTEEYEEKYQLGIMDKEEFLNKY